MTAAPLRFWNRQARTYDVSMRILGRPLPRMLALTRAHLAGMPRVLEVAAGTGLVTAAVAPLVGELVATDYAPAMVERLRARVQAQGLTHVRCLQADLFALPTAPGSFDAVLAANVLHLLPELPRALAAIRAALRPGGRLVVPTFLHAQTRTSRTIAWLMERFGFPAQRRLSLAGLVALLREGGFAIDTAELIPGPLPIGFVSAHVPA